MHELGIVFHMIDTLKEVCAAQNVLAVQRVTLELGEVSTVLPDQLADCWKWAIKREPLLTEAELVIEPIPAITLCRDCGKQYPTVAHGRVCPHCGSGQTHLVQGTEVNIKEIAVT